jgi:chemotaxis protein CheD
MATYTIGIAEKVVSKAPDKLVTLGLGSCVGLVLFDPVKKVGGLVHIMLPSAPTDVPVTNKFKFADTAVEEMIRLITEAGGIRHQLQAKLVGGAHMFNNAYQTDVMGIGKRNVDICQRVLREHRIPIAAQDTGGSSGRSIEFSCEDNMLQIRTVSPKSVRLI